MAESFPSVYHSLDSILQFLHTGQHSDLPEVTKLLQIFNDNYVKDAPSTAHPHPFVVFEGLDGAGKSTMFKKLQKKIDGHLAITPPACMKHLREWFDDQPSRLKRAYYSLGNYIAAQEIGTMLQTKPVFTDRFWHSTAAYAIATEVKYNNVELPPPGDSVYRWPSDLMKPDIVLFMDVCEPIRLTRLSRRTSSTPEEDLLASDTQFRNNILEIHKRISGVEYEVVNCNRFPNKVLPDCYNIVKRFM